VRETFIPVLAKKIGNIYVDLVQLESREIEQDQMVPHRIGECRNYYALPSPDSGPAKALEPFDD
jgi:hypothetical protein